MSHLMAIKCKGCGERFEGKDTKVISAEVHKTCQNRVCTMKPNLPVPSSNIINFTRAASRLKKQEKAEKKRERRAALLRGKEPPPPVDTETKVYIEHDKPHSEHIH